MADDALPFCGIKFPVRLKFFHVSNMMLAKARVVRLRKRVDQGGEAEALEDTQQGIDWYNEQQSGLDRKFLAEVKSASNHLRLIHSFRSAMIMFVACL